MVHRSRFSFGDHDRSREVSVMKNDELPQAGGFPDDKISKHLRETIGLPDEWRVWYFEMIPDGVFIRGSLCRPVAKHEDDNGSGWKVIKPYKMKRQRTLDRGTYGRLIG